MTNHSQILASFKRTNRLQTS